MSRYPLPLWRLVKALRFSAISFHSPVLFGVRESKDPAKQQRLPQAVCHCRLTLARLNKPRRLLFELQRVTSPLRLRHLRYPFALEQLSKEYVLRGQGQVS